MDAPLVVKTLSGACVVVLRPVLNKVGTTGPALAILATGATASTKLTAVTALRFRVAAVGF